jgi:hypothetical protein
MALTVDVSLYNGLSHKGAIVTIDSIVWERGNSNLRFLARAYAGEGFPSFWEAWMECPHDITNPDPVAQAESYFLSRSDVAGAIFSVGVK